MKIDDKTFFHQATLRICGSLDINTTISNCFQYFKSLMPLNGLALNAYDFESGEVHCVAMASNIGAKVWESILVLPLEARLQIQQDYETVTIHDKFDLDPLGRYFCSATGLSRVSGVVLRLRVHQERLGGVVAFAHGHNCYGPEHARLLSLVHDPFSIAMSNSLRYREVLKLQELLKDDNRYLSRELHRISGDEIVGEDFGLRDVMHKVRQVAPLDSQVLLLGETGVGKEVIANAIHYSSPRRHGPLVKVNCGAIPETLLDSELFGHEKGAFTGALARKRGLFERAHRGTIFLDEIGELPPAAQVRLLRVLQTKEIVRLGGAESLRTDVRVIAATHRDLGDMVRMEEFREDLWYRLNVFPIAVPPLRERKMDIPALVNHFITRKASEMNFRYRPVPSAPALARLQAYDWPGNVRELENAVERELILSQSRRPEDALQFRGFSRNGRSSLPPSILPDVGDLDTLDVVIRNHIIRALHMSGGKVEGRSGAAAILGTNPNTLRSRMRRMGIPFGKANKKGG